MLVEDLKLALRGFWQRPSFFVLAILTLALGIGASSAIFTVVNAVVLRPLPYEEPEQIVMVLEQNLSRGWVWYTVSPANYLDWAEEEDLFQSMAAYSLYSDTGYNLTGGSAPERVTTSAVTAEFFRVFRTPALLGRTFQQGEDQPGQGQVVVLSYGLWQRRFGGNDDILDQTVLLDGEPHRVVGVMPADFRYPDGTELWLPLVFGPQERSNRTIRSLFVVGRLADGRSLDAAQARMTAVGKRLEAAYPESNSGFGVVIHRLHDRVVGEVRPALLLLMGAVLFLLLIACANVANLVLARTAARRRELALRQVFGASRVRLGRLLLVESLALGIAGGVLGLVLAWLAARLLLALAPENLPRLDGVGLDGWVLLFTAATAVGTAVLASLAPLARLRQLQLTEAMNASTRGSSGGRKGNRTQSAIIVVQVAFALMLLVGAGLTARSFLQLQGEAVGFRSDSLLSMQIALPADKYPEFSAQGLFYSELLARVEAQPGVTAAAVTSWLPFASVPVDWDFHVEGRPPEKLDDAVVSGFRSVSPSYFETMGIPLLRGRVLQPSDRQDSPTVVVINETMARRFWAGADPVGERIVLGDLVQHMLPGLPLRAEIVGVVGDVKQGALDLPVEPEMYVPFPQYGWPSMFLLARAEGEAEDLTAAIRDQLRTMDPSQPIYDVKTMRNRVQDSMAEPRLTVLLLSLFGAMALLLASIGIYGVISYAMSRKTREVGTRMALGADRKAVIRFVLIRGLTPPLLGLFAGLLGALALSRLLRSILFEVSPLDPLTFLAVVLLLLAVACLAALIPALRVSRIDPLRALREE